MKKEQARAALYMIRAELRELHQYQHGLVGAKLRFEDI